MSMSVCLYVYLSTLFMSGVLRGQKKDLRAPPEVELQFRATTEDFYLVDVKDLQMLIITVDVARN